MVRFALPLPDQPREPGRRDEDSDARGHRQREQYPFEGQVTPATWRADVAPCPPPPDPPRLETTERRWPTCRAQRIASMGQIAAVAGQIKEKYWWEACGRAF
jgi:hypothetical protein